MSNLTIFSILHDTYSGTVGAFLIAITFAAALIAFGIQARRAALRGEAPELLRKRRNSVLVMGLFLLLSIGAFIRLNSLHPLF